MCDHTLRSVIVKQLMLAIKLRVPAAQILLPRQQCRTLTLWILSKCVCAKFVKPQSRSQSLLTSYGACTMKTKALERTGSNSPQIAHLLYCISDNQSGSSKNQSFPEPSFSSSMRRKKLAGSGNEFSSHEDPTNG